MFFVSLFILLAIKWKINAVILKKIHKLKESLNVVYQVTRPVLLFCPANIVTYEKSMNLSYGNVLLTRAACMMLPFVINYLPND